MLAPHSSTRPVRSILQEDRDLIVWWATEIECVSALSRLERQQSLTANGVAEAYRRLHRLKAVWIEVEPVERVRDTARRLLRTHDLRAADALQLAAALIAGEGLPESLEFVTLDRRLSESADREGLAVVDI